MIEKKKEGRHKWSYGLAIDFHNFGSYIRNSPLIRVNKTGGCNARMGITIDLA